MNCRCLPAAVAASRTENGSTVELPCGWAKTLPPPRRLIAFGSPKPRTPRSVPK